MLSLDISKAYRTRVSGDIRIVYTWVDGERALVLMPAVRTHAPWFVVAESAAFRWDDSDPRTVPVVAARAAKACNVLGIEANATNCQRVARIVIEGLEDLVRMPHEPADEYEGAVIGQLQARADGEVIAQRPVRIPALMRASYGA